MMSPSTGQLAFLLIYLVDISIQQSSAQWDALNVTVQGRLVQGVPFARPCFQLTNGTGGEFNSDECSVVIQDYLDEGIAMSLFIFFCVVAKVPFPSKSFA